MLKFLKFNGEDLPVRVSYYAIKMLKAELNKPMSEMKEDDYDAYECLLFYSLKRGFKKAGKEFTFKMDDMEDIMDEVFFDFLRLIPEFFSNFNQEEIPETKIERKAVVSKK